jgi:hypothetical protein
MLNLTNFNVLQWFLVYVLNNNTSASFFATICSIYFWTNLIFLRILSVNKSMFFKILNEALRDKLGEVHQKWLGESKNRIKLSYS